MGNRNNSGITVFVGALTGFLMLAILIGVSVLSWPGQSAAQEEVIGIGVKLSLYKVSLVGQDNTQEPLGTEVEVKEVLPNSPAASAGLMIGDSIITINGQNTGRMDYEEVINSIRGEEGAYVELSVLRFVNPDKQGEIDFEKDFLRLDFRIKREKIKTN